jgi:hypothetical protein
MGSSIERPVAGIMIRHTYTTETMGKFDDELVYVRKV